MLGKATGLASTDTCELNGRPHDGEPCPPATLCVFGPTVARITVCYLCAGDTKAAFEAQGHKGVVINSLAYMRREPPYDKVPIAQPAASTPSPHDHITAGVPACDFAADGTIGHGLGFVKIAGTPPVHAQGAPASFRVCNSCFNDVCDLLRERGYIDLRCTAPEQPQLRAHLNFYK